MKILSTLLAGFLVFVIATVLAFVYLPWWQAVLVSIGVAVALLVALIVLVRLLAKVITKGVGAVFDVKAQVMKGATVEVHSIEATAPPPAEEGGGEATGEEGEEAAPAEPRNYYRIDVTIAPTAELKSEPEPEGEHLHVIGDASALALWSAPELKLVPADAPAETSLLKRMLEGYQLEHVEWIEEGAITPDDGEQRSGSRRLRFVVAVPPAVKELQFNYYGEAFGRLPLSSLNVAP